MYMEYHRLEVAKWQEEQWKNEKIKDMYVELTETGRVETFLELYEIAEAFHDMEKLTVLYRSLLIIAMPIKPKSMVELAETILGKRNRNVRSGMIYWAYDLQYVKLTGTLFLYVEDCLEGIHTWDIYMIRRIQRAKNLHRMMREELGY
ncbi:MAG: hypothetical protein NC307_14645 [Roseburia sp.]|nr:hypothetical protein [Roseburia sp.]